MTMGIFWLINLITVANLTINQIEHLIKLASDLVNKTTQSSWIIKCLSQ
jgi:hypothetical protein